MSTRKIEDLRFSSSSVDDFFATPQAPAGRVASGRIRVSGMRDLVGFVRVADDKLVRLSQKDFWKLGQDDDGHYIERLVSDDKGPVQG